MKKCSTCKQLKDETEFYEDKRTPDGLKYQCKECHMESSIRSRDEDLKRKHNREYMQRERKRNPEKYRKRERIFSRVRPKNKKYLARKKLNNALKRGAINKPNKCNGCGKETKVTAHHENYEKPLDVEWLCYECHGKKHRKTI
jgi:hypothetical protein